MRYVKYIKVLAIGLALGAAAALILICRVEHPRPAAAPPSPNASGAFPRERFKRVPVKEDRVPLTTRLRPGRKKTRAEELLAGMPAGTVVYEIKTAPGDETLIYRSPTGEVFVPNETTATVSVYRKPAPLAAFEFRPGVFAWTDLTRLGGGLGVGVVRIGRVHAGPAASYDSRREFAVGAAAAYNVWRNVDAGVYGAKTMGKEGWRGGGLITVNLFR